MESAILAVVACFFSIILSTSGEQQIVFKVLKNSMQLGPDSTISIANVSDIFIDIQCLVVGEESDSMRQWLIQPSEGHSIPTPLSPSQTSYDAESGILRVYSRFITHHAPTGELRLQCRAVSSNKMATITLTLSPSFLFEPETHPTEANSSSEVASLCASSLPTLPVSSLSIQGDVSQAGTNYSYCYVDTELGRFRSRSIVTGGAWRLSRIFFNDGFPTEVVEWASSDSVAVSLPCRVGGLTSVLGGHHVHFLKNGVRISETAQQEDGAYIRGTSWVSRQVLMVVKRRGSEGVYQCVGETGEDQSTSIVTSTYVNIQYLEEPRISISSDSPQWRTDNVIVLGQPQTPRELVLNCSVEAHPIPSISWTRRDGDTLKEVEGVQLRTEYRETAYSELRLHVSQLKAKVEFVCRAAIGNRSQQASMVITAYSRVVLSEQPRVVASSNAPSRPLLSCTATSVPAARIVWYEQRGRRTREMTNNGEGTVVIRETVEEEGDNCTVISKLQIEPITDLSDAAAVGYYCRGDNGFFVNKSATFYPLQSVPGKPEVIVAGLTPNSMTIEWTPPLSLLALRQYTLTLYLREESTQILRPRKSAIVSTRPGSETRYTFDTLAPHTTYAVELEVHDIANNKSSSGPVIVQTLEDAPQAPPQDIVAEAKNVDKIRVSWSPPPTHLQNGVIRSYSVRYSPLVNPSQSSIVNNIIDTEALLHLPLSPGMWYGIEVVAVTVEMGPFSKEVVQKTYPQPPSIISGPPIMVSNAEVTENTITVQLPPVNTSEFSHFWVVAMKLDGTVPLQSETIMPTATTEEETPQTNSPYVVAEMKPENYQENRLLFVLGDNSKTRALNDFPNLYRNYPLTAGSTYTVFVRAFAPYLPPSRVDTRAKKQAREEDPMRQYAVFSDSELLPYTATLSAAGNGPSQVEVLIFVAVGVVCLLVLTVVVVILIVRRRLRAMMRRTSPSHADEMKFSNARVQQPIGNDNSLPRELSLRGDGTKHEEHIYEDPLFLKSRDAYSDIEPTYKVPRPVSLDNELPSNDVGYEVISPSGTKQSSRRGGGGGGRGERGRKAEAAELAVPGHNGCYEVMRHPSSVGKESILSFPTSSPTPYLKPVGVANTEEISSGYSLITRRDINSRSCSPCSGETETKQYENITTQEYLNGDIGTRKYSALQPENMSPYPQEYVEMKSVTPKHCSRT